jgi:hypothetical protein
MVVAIGARWLARTEHGRPRLDDPEDLVRTEIRIALDQGVTVVPLLVEDA